MDRWEILPKNYQRAISYSFIFAEVGMTDLEKKIKLAQKKVASQKDNEDWVKSVRETDKQMDKILEKLKQDSKVDPRLLEDPATL
jgi:membrane-anchored protein YejM (alkaline phosphatase superfamily)